MVRRLVLVLVLLATPRAHAEDTPDTPFDRTVDECAAPDSGCLPDTGDPTDAALEAAELAMPAATPPLSWTVATTAVRCATGATEIDGTCVADADYTATVDGGCSTGRLPGLALALAALALLVWARRRRRALLMVIAACSFDGGSYDDAVDAGPTGDADAYVDVFTADLGDGDGVQFLLANQSLREGAQQPEAQFALLREQAGVPIYRVPGACGDRLATDGGDELLGWAHAGSGDRTTELVELAAPDGCAFVYEIETETIATLVADGYTRVGVVAHVWPPGLGEAPPPAEPMAPQPVAADPDAPAPCPITASSPVQLLYASPGKDFTLRFLIDCPGEVIVGEKRETGPVGMMKSAAAKAAGGRTAFVVDRNGDKLRELLMRDNGVERTVAYFKHKLQLGYDYIVIDEITAAGDFRDGATLNKRLRKLLLRMPERSIIPYISIDLTQYATGFANMRARRLLLRAFKLRARTLAIEVYLHTPQVKAGAAPATFRRAADRLALAVKGLTNTAGINRRAITVVGTSIHAGGSGFLQYAYLDQPSYDLASLSRQVNAIRHGSARLRQQKGVGWYFVNKSDMDPRPGGYSYDALIRRMRLLGLRFRT